MTNNYLYTNTDGSHSHNAEGKKQTQKVNYMTQFTKIQNWAKSIYSEEVRGGWGYQLR